MDPQAFNLIRDSLVRIEDKIDKHADEDAKVHKLVERHNMYVNIAFMGLPALVGILAKKLGVWE